MTETIGAGKPVRYISFSLLDLTSDRELPGNLYLCIHHKMIRYKNKGDALDAASFNKLIYNQIKIIFIEETDRKAFDDWTDNQEENKQIESVKKENPDVAEIVEAKQQQRRAIMDIFNGPRDDRQVKAAIDTSKRLVTEFLKKPFAINNIQSIQSYSKGCLDHSVNVSVLSVFLGIRLGYTHQLILENLALGGLFHDIGKVLIDRKDDGAMSEHDEELMKQHPKLGAELIEKKKEVPNEVRMIVAQHHEFLDGSGYPNKLKGLAIYDLARLVVIANIYDELISDSKAENMKERTQDALAQLEKNYEGKLDPKKLEKIIKILRYSFV